MNRTSGIALIAVMAALMILSAIGLGVAAAVQAEARIDRTDFDALQAEQLVRSGHEFASFLEARGLTKTPDFMAGLPFAAVTPGFHYRAQTSSGVVDIYFEADNGKINPSLAPPELIRNFSELWRGDLTKAQFMTAAIEDWRDQDNDTRPNGAEASDYAGFNFSPRNAGIGIADLPLVRGFSTDDFQLKLMQSGPQPRLREPIGAFITDANTGNAVNPNFAAELVLRAVPNLTDSQISAIVRGRKDRPFDDTSDLQARSGLPSDSPAWRYLTLARNAAAVRVVARLNGTAFVRTERRVAYRFDFLSLVSGVSESKAAVGRIERELFPESP